MGCSVRIVYPLSSLLWITSNLTIKNSDWKINGSIKLLWSDCLEIFFGRWGKKLKRIGLHLGFIGIICLNLLFLPVSRGSVLLRAIDIPFEHAVKYHMWLGHFMMTLFTLHGLSYIIAWYSEDRLIKVSANNSLFFRYASVQGISFVAQIT